jgi:hypothetical protein
MSDLGADARLRSAAFATRRAGSTDHLADRDPIAPVLGLPMGAAALVVGGGLVVVFPQHTETLLRLLLGTVAVGLLALGINAVRQRDWLDSPFERDNRGGRLRSDAVPGLGSIEGALLESTVPAHGMPLPPGVRRRLFSVAATVIDRDGIDLLDPAQRDAARARVSAHTWGVISDELSRSRAPRGRRRVSPADTAALVHAVLDDLERVRSGSRHLSPTGAA